AFQSSTGFQVSPDGLRSGRRVIDLPTLRVWLLRVLIKRHSVQIFLERLGIFSKIVHQPDRCARGTDPNFVGVRSGRAGNCEKVVAQGLLPVAFQVGEENRFRRGETATAASWQCLKSYRRASDYGNGCWSVSTSIDACDPHIDLSLARTFSNWVLRRIRPGRLQAASRGHINDTRLPKQATDGSVVCLDCGTSLKASRGRRDSDGLA